MGRAFNYEPLTPTAFLHRSANVFPDRIGVVDGDIRFTYGEFLDRCAAGSPVRCARSASSRAIASRCWPATRT